MYQIYSYERWYVDSIEGREREIEKKTDRIFLHELTFSIKKFVASTWFYSIRNSRERKDPIPHTYIKYSKWCDDDRMSLYPLRVCTLYTHVHATNLIGKKAEKIEIEWTFFNNTNTSHMMNDFCCNNLFSLFIYLFALLQTNLLILFHDYFDQIQMTYK